MGAESVALGVGVNLIAAGLLSAGTATRDHIRDGFQEAQFPTEIDAVETVFMDALKESVDEIDSRRDTGELTDVAEQWDPVVCELYGVEEASEIEGVDRILFETEEDAVDEIAAAIARATSGLDLADAPTLERELKQAVTSAYNKAIAAFVTEIDESVATQFQTASHIELLQHLQASQRTLEDLHDRLSLQRYDLHPGDETGREQVAEKLERNLHDPEAAIEYVPRPEIEDYEYHESLLLLGPGGSGKSRTLIERVRNHTDVAHIIYPHDEFQNPGDANAFAMHTFDGDVLLVWDDIHKINPEEKNTVVRKTITELRELLDPEAQLHVLAAGRIEHLEEFIPGNPYNDDDLWQNIQPVELADVDHRVLAEIIEHAIAVHDEISVGEDAKEALLRKALYAEPTPLFVTSVLENVDDELTETDIEELPESTVKIWREENYPNLDEKSKQILRAMKILGELAPRSAFKKSLLRGVYAEVFDGSEAGFDTPLSTVVEQYWLIERTTDDGSEYGIHDVKREAIEQEFERWLVENLSELLLENAGRFFGSVSLPKSRVLHGNFARQVEQYDWGRELALEHCQYILDNIDDEDAVTHYNYGNLLKKGGETEEAKRRYEQAIDADPDYAKAYYNYGVLLLEEGETEEAKRRFKQSVAIWRDRGRFDNAIHDLVTLVAICIEQDDYDAAVEYAADGIELCIQVDDDPRRGFVETIRAADGDASPDALIRGAYRAALACVTDKQDQVAHTLFVVAFRQHGAIEGEERRHAYSAGVGMVALHNVAPGILGDDPLVEVDHDDPGALLAEVTNYADLLRPPVANCLTLLADIAAEGTEPDEMDESLRRREVAAFERLSTLVM